jgi:hypothetical protein
MIVIIQHLSCNRRWIWNITSLSFQFWGDVVSWIPLERCWQCWDLRNAGKSTVYTCTSSIMLSYQNDGQIIPVDK